MKPGDLEKIETEGAFVAMLKQHGLFRENDVTFEDFGEGMFVYTGDDFSTDTELLESQGVSALLVRGSVEVERLLVSEILGDIGVLVVTGDVVCKDMLYMTECTGVVIGGGLTIANAFYADCGNSVLQVNGDLTAKLFFNSQCSVDVRGEVRFELDEEASEEDLCAMLGVEAEEGADPDDIVQEYFERHEES